MAGFPTITYFVQNFTYLAFLFVENMLESEGIFTNSANKLIIIFF